MYFRAASANYKVISHNFIVPINRYKCTIIRLYQSIIINHYKCKIIFQLRISDTLHNLFVYCTDVANYTIVEPEKFVKPNMAPIVLDQTVHVQLANTIL